MNTCWRCGISFEGTGDVCRDCREVEPEAVTHWPVPADYIENVWEDRWELVGPMYRIGMFDSEIADKLAIPKSAVTKTRQHFGHPANVRPEEVGLWKDQEAQRQHASTMVKYRVAAKRGSLGRMTNFKS